MLEAGSPGGALVKEIYQSNKNDIYVLEWEKLLIETLQGYHTIAQEQHESIDPDKLSGIVGAANDIVGLVQKGARLKAEKATAYYKAVQKLTDALCGEAINDLNARTITADQLETLNQYISESQSAKNSSAFWSKANKGTTYIGDVLEYAGIAFKAYSDFSDIQEHEKKLEEFAGLLIEYEQNLYILQSISESTNNPELQKACSNVANDLTNLLWDPESFIYRENSSYSTEYVLSSALEVMKGASPLGILTLPDVFGQWDAAHLSGLQLQTLSVMDASIKDEAYNAATNDSTDDYYLTELYRVLQLNGLNQSKDYVNKFDDAWGINASDLGISNVNSYIEAIDDQIIRNVELQNNLLAEYNEATSQE